MHEILKELEEKRTDVSYGDIIGYSESEDNLRYFEVVNDGRIKFLAWGLIAILSPFMMQNLPKFDTTGQYSVNYRVASRADSVQDSFFIKGNEVMKQKMNGEYPWRKKT